MTNIQEANSFESNEKLNITLKAEILPQKNCCCWCGCCKWFCYICAPIIVVLIVLALAFVFYMIGKMNAYVPPTTTTQITPLKGHDLYKHILKYVKNS